MRFSSFINLDEDRKSKLISMSKELKSKANSTFFMRAANPNAKAEINRDKYRARRADELVHGLVAKAAKSRKLEKSWGSKVQEEAIAEAKVGSRLAKFHSWVKRKHGIKEERIEEISKNLALRYAHKANKSAEAMRDANATKSFPSSDIEKKADSREKFADLATAKATGSAKVPATGKINWKAYRKLQTEEIGPKATASDYIDDFVHSKNKKFEGDSKKQRIRRALGAYYNAKGK